MRRTFFLSQRSRGPILRRRSFLLLEVMIAMTLVLLCMTPLLGPHLTMYLEEKRFIQEIEANRLIEIIFTDQLIEKFYRQNIEWGSIVDRIPIDFDDSRLEEIGYRGKVTVGIERKQGGDASQSRRSYLLGIQYDLTSSNFNRPLQFFHKLAVTHAGDIEGDEGDEEL